MAVGRFILKHNYTAPYSRITGNPRRPQKIGGVRFRKGDVIIGELKHVNNQPAVVLMKKEGVDLPFPISVLTEVVEKGAANEAASSSADGSGTPKPSIVSSNPKVQYLDAAILGGLIGFGLVLLAEKQNWIQVPMEGSKNKNKAIGALVGIAAGVWLLWRTKNSKPKKSE